MVGADICGFFIDMRDAEMCTRWLQVGSFYSFTSIEAFFLNLTIKNVLNSFK